MPTTVGHRTPSRHGARNSSAFRAGAGIARYVWKNRSQLRTGANNAFSAIKKVWKGSAKKHKKVVHTPVRTPLEGLPAGITSDYWSHTIAARKPLSKALGKFKFTQQGGTTAFGNPGQQTVTCVISHITRGQCITSSGAGATLNQFPTKIMDLNPNRYNTGSVLYTGGAAGVAPTNEKVHVKSVITDMQLYNITNAPIQVDLYYLLCKKPTANDPATDWNALLQLEADGIAAGTNASEAAGGALTSGNLGYPNFAMYGQTPLTCRSFRKVWKCIKKKFYTIAPGEVQRLKYRINFNKTINIAPLSVMSSDYGLAGTTVTVLMVSRGTICLIEGHDDTAAPGVASGGVASAGVGPQAGEFLPLIAGKGEVGITMSGPKIGWLCSSTYEFQGIGGGQNVDTSYIQANYVSSFTGSPADKPFIVTAMDAIEPEESF